jgi:2-aminobenzoate-CoA ligase
MDGELNCISVLLDHAVRDGEGWRTLFHTETGTQSYSYVSDLVNKIAHTLVDDCGLQPGNRVLLRGGNSPMIIMCWAAVLKVGAICVSTMPLLRAKELIEIGNTAQIDLVLCDYKWKDDLLNAGSSCTNLLNVKYFNSKGADNDIELLAASKPPEFETYATRATDVAIMAFTSGTTGKSKATLHTHRDILAVCECFPPARLQPTPEDIYCGSPPIGFVYGLGGLLLFPMYSRASVVLLEQASPQGLLAQISKYRATICFATPLMYRYMADMVKDYDVSSLRKCVSAGEHLSQFCYRQWLALTNLKIIDGIGTTELLHIFLASSDQDANPNPGGVPVPGYEVRIFDPEGNPLPPEQAGLLGVRGPTGCKYFEDPAQQRAYVKNGWNITGDLYLQDEAGYFWYQSRSHDLIVSAGYNISPIEVEEVLLQHPSVLECAVIGAPDPVRGEVVKAFVVLDSVDRSKDALEQELKDFVKSQIAPFKYPREIEFVPHLPRTSTGKVQRSELREWSHARLLGVN